MDEHHWPLFKMSRLNLRWPVTCYITLPMLGVAFIYSRVAECVLNEIELHFHCLNLATKGVINQLE